jgi:AraC-like DNA-binding protein
MVGAMLVYPVSPAWILLLRDLGIDAKAILRRAGIADDLLERDHAVTTADEFARMMRSLDEVARDPTLALKIGEALSFEMFDAPVFAAMCSDNLNSALERLGRYKQLCAPIAFDLSITSEATRVAFEWTGLPAEPPPLLFAFELAYSVKLARLGTRRHIVPRAVTCAIPLEPAAAYREYFGVAVERGEPAVTFDAADAATPFLTAKAGMWSFFEPELRRRLAELEAGATTTQRVRAALLELLPSGRAAVQAVAHKLAISSRTLQRRLQEERTTFQQVLDKTREELARHYLTSTTLAGSEISFLLGFEDPNSFVRAFHEWTGVTPEQVRQQRPGAVGWSLGATR